MPERTLIVAVFNETQKWTIPEREVERLREGLPEGVRATQVDSRAALLEALPDADYLMGLPLAASQFTRRENRLRFIQLVNPAAESLAPYEAALASQTRVAGTAHIRAPQTAEHIVLLILALLRRLPVAVRAQTARRWATAETAHGVRELAGATVGVVNMGVIGREFVQRIGAFGCDVIATGTNESDAALVDRFLEPERIDELVSRANIVVLADASAGETRPILNRPLLEQIGPESALINVARGGAIEEEELLRALRKNVIGAAALDVCEHRPLPPGSPLWSAENVIITPSVAGASDRYWRRAVDVTIENIRRLESGDDLLDEITPAAAAGA